LFALNGIKGILSRLLDNHRCNCFRSSYIHCVSKNKTLDFLS